MSLNGTAMVELSYQQLVEAAFQLSPELQDSFLAELKERKSKRKDAPKKLTKKQAARKARILKSLDESIAEVKAYVDGDKTTTRPASELLHELRGTDN